MRFSTGFHRFFLFLFLTRAVFSCMTTTPGSAGIPVSEAPQEHPDLQSLANERLAMQILKKQTLTPDLNSVVDLPSPTPTLPIDKVNPLSPAAERKSKPDVKEIPVSTSTTSSTNTTSTTSTTRTSSRSTSRVTATTQTSTTIVTTPTSTAIGTTQTSTTTASAQTSKITVATPTSTTTATPPISTKAVTTPTSTTTATKPTSTATVTTTTSRTSKTSTPRPTRTTTTSKITSTVATTTSTSHMLKSMTTTTKPKSSTVKNVEKSKGCQISDIKYTPPAIDMGQMDGVLFPNISCSSGNSNKCSVALISCRIPSDSKFPLVSAFAHIETVDWATTDLKMSLAEFNLVCDAQNRWTYVSDIPTLVGRIYPTTKVFCLLVPVLTADYDYYLDLGISE